MGGTGRYPQAALHLQAHPRSSLEMLELCHLLVGICLALFPLQACLLGPELAQEPLSSGELLLQLGRCHAMPGDGPWGHWGSWAVTQTPLPASPITYRPELRARASWMPLMSRWACSIFSCVWKSCRFRARLALLPAWYKSLLLFFPP